MESNILNEATTWSWVTFLVRQCAVLTVILTFSGQQVWGQIISGIQPLVFETNGVEAMRIGVDGDVHIGPSGLCCYKLSL